MSKETMEWLNNNTLIGMTEKRGTAWHRNLSLVNGLDNHYSGAIPEEDILSRLFNWKAEERAVYVDGGGSNGLMLDESRKAIVRNDTNLILGMHSDGYQIHHFDEWLITNLSRLVGREAVFANAGLLAMGSIAWVQIEMPENIDVPGGVEFRPFLLATTSLDGSIASTFKPGYTNVVCDNTREIALGENTSEYRVKHTRKSQFVLADAAAAVNTLHMIAEEASKSITDLLSIDVSDAQWSQFVQAHVPLKDDAGKTGITLAENKRAALTGLYRTDVRVAPWSGTAWGVVQAVNTYNEHIATVRNVGREERKMHRAVKGEIGTADNAALATLKRVLVSA